MSTKKRHLTNYWISYSDLMAGLLFVLLAIVVISHVQYKERTKVIGESINLRKHIAGELKKRFAEQSISSVEVDDKTGDIVFTEKDDLVWFKKDKYFLLQGARQVLDEVIPIYLDVLFDKTITKDKLDRILIEGHASQEINLPWRYLKDLQLSENRALSVGTYVIQNNDNYYDQLKKHLVALGRSFADAKYKGIDNQNRWRDRKVLIRFTLEYEQMMRELQNRVS